MTAFSWHAEGNDREAIIGLRLLGLSSSFLQRFFQFLQPVARSEKGLIVKVFHIWSLVPKY